MGRLVVVDHGAGNLPNVVRALTYIGARPEVSADPKVIESADRLVVPGVGAFGDCMEQLQVRGLRDALALFRSKERPFLGICVGMQMLFDESEEFGPVAGLGWIPGRVQGLVPSASLKVPHMGWSQVQWTGFMDSSNPQGIAQDYYYFVHSFHVIPQDPSVVVGRVHLAEPAQGASGAGASICAAVRSGSILAVQFHPEKSDSAGMRLLSSFLKWSP